MPEPYISEIRIFPYGRVPEGWARCDGQTLSITGNEALFALIGTRYGGNGQTTFRLPDLRGRVPMHAGERFPLGDRPGVEAHRLSMLEIPGEHTHPVLASSELPDMASPSGNVLGAIEVFGPGGKGDETVPLARGVVEANEGDQAHENRQPFTSVQFCIALKGNFPSRP